MSKTKNYNFDDLKIYQTKQLRNQNFPLLKISKNGYISLNNNFLENFKDSDNLYFSILFSKKNNAVGILESINKGLPAYKLSATGYLVVSRKFYSLNEIELCKATGTYIPKMINTKYGNAWFIFLDKKMDLSNPIENKIPIEPITKREYKKETNVEWDKWDIDGEFRISIYPNKQIFFNSPFNNRILESRHGKIKIINGGKNTINIAITDSTGENTFDVTEKPLMISCSDFFNKYGLDAKKLAGVYKPIQVSKNGNLWVISLPKKLIGKIKI
jgi:hypothetical protein